MKRRNFIRAVIGGGMSLWVVAGESKRAVHWRDSTFTGLGTVLTIRAAHPHAPMLDHALQRARQVVARLEDEMSLFRPRSAVCQLNHAGVLHRPSADVLRVFQISQQVATRSRGDFDVTVQPLWQLYAQAQKQNLVPEANAVAHVRRQVGWQNLHVSADRIQLMQPSMAVTLNGIAQGYVADAVRNSLKQDGVTQALINTGEWSSIGLADGERPWTLGIADPRRAEAWLTRVQMNGLSVATSADDQCAFSADLKHHHIFDPHTGYSPQDIASVTVAASSCVMADALTKVLFVAGYDRALEVAKGWGVLALVVKKNGLWKASDHWPGVTT